MQSLLNGVVENGAYRGTNVDPVAVFYDRENSLLVCVVVAPRKDDKMSLNIYPGVVKVAGVSPGLVLAVGGARGLSLGGDPCRDFRSGWDTSAVRVTQPTAAKA